MEPEIEEVWIRREPQRSPWAKDKPDKSRILEWEVRKRRRDKSHDKSASPISSVGSVVNLHERKEDTWSWTSAHSLSLNVFALFQCHSWFYVPCRMVGSLFSLINLVLWARQVQLRATLLSLARITSIKFTQINLSGSKAPIPDRLQKKRVFRGTQYFYDQ